MTVVTTMSNQARQARNEYMKAWREKNGDKLQEYNKRYWERQAALKSQQAMRDKYPDS